MAGIFKWVVLICICYIGMMAFFASNSIIKDTPVYNQSDSVMVNSSTQTNAFIDLGASIAPGLLLLLAGWIVVKSLGGAE